MKTKQFDVDNKNDRPEVIPQVKVRSGLCGGSSLENCERALAAWKRSYYRWYDAAKYKSV